MKVNHLQWACVLAITVGLALGGRVALAEDNSKGPSGWGKGEKKGWQGGQVPPGLADKEKQLKDEAQKAEKEARKKKMEAEKSAEKQKKEAEKAKREAEKEAKKKQREAEKEAEKAKKLAEETKKPA